MTTTKVASSTATKTDILVVDGDGHYGEPFSIFDDYLDQKYREHAPRLEGEGAEQRQVWPHFTQENRPGMGLGDNMTPRRSVGSQPSGKGWHDGIAGGFDGHARLIDMDTDGIEGAVLFPSLGLTFHSVPDVDAQAALIEAGNRFLADYCSADPHRLFGIANLPFADPVRSAEILRHWVNEAGFVGGMIRPNPTVNGRLLRDPENDILWAAAQDLGVPIAVHEGAVPIFQRLGNTRMPDPVSRHVLGHPMEGMAAFTALYISGVFERFREFKVGFMESGCGWLPFVVDRIDEHFENVYRSHKETFGLTLDAQEVVASGRVTVGCEGDDRFIKTNMDMYGKQSVIWASDYPHTDAIFPGSADAMLARKDLTHEELAAVAGGNAVTFFNLQLRA